MMENKKNNENNNMSKKTTFQSGRLPKNIRQIGQINNDKRIYIEDYVMTYMKQLAIKNYGVYQSAVLLGRTEQIEGIDHIFIEGAVEVENIAIEEEKAFSNEAWTKIYEKIKEYFSKLEIVGWYLTRPGLELELNEKIKKVHIDNFAGVNKVLLMYDSVEQEELFYVYEKNGLVRQNGYYIYYEKNHTMQSYMIENKKKPSIEINYVDRAGTEIRSVLEKKKVGKATVESKPRASSMYAVASLFAVILLIAVVTTVTNSQKNNKPAQQVSSGKFKMETSIPTSLNTEDETTVNTINGEVGSIKSEEINGDVTGKVTTQLPQSDTNNTPSVNDSEPTVTIEDTEPIEKETTDPIKNESKETVASEKIHVVVKGDTLSSISLKYYDTKSKIKSIMKENNLKNEDRIYIGQKLKLP